MEKYIIYFILGVIIIFLIYLNINKRYESFTTDVLDIEAVQNISSIYNNNLAKFKDITVLGKLCFENGMCIIPQKCNGSNNECVDNDKATNQHNLNALKITNGSITGDAILNQLCFHKTKACLKPQLCKIGPSQTAYDGTCVNTDNIDVSKYPDYFISAISMPIGDFRLNDSIHAREGQITEKLYAEKVLGSPIKK